MHEPFQQPPPALANQYADDRVLRSFPRRPLAPDMLAQVAPHLSSLGELAGGELYRAQLADRGNEPVLTQWGAWGERDDLALADDQPLPAE
jgi:acyl-CoA dehydrogenase